MMGLMRELMVGAALILCAPAGANPTQEGYTHALSLRERTMYLTDGVADPAVWSADGQSFHYRRTVPGGFRFVSVRLSDRVKQDAFDHARLATAIGAVTGATYRADRLPFSDFAIGADSTTLMFTVADTRLRCALTSYVCTPVAAPPGRPKAVGVLRDLTVPADNTPRQSPDGRHIATVEDDNLVVRTTDGRVVTRSTDGSPGNFYDPETITWSPDSVRIAVNRVRAGHRREIYRVASSPANQIEPKLITQLYPKPGDAIDIDRPILFDVAKGSQIDIDPALFANPYTISKIVWRSDSQSFSFTYNQRGHGVYRLVEVDARTGTPREVVAERSDTFVYAPRMDHRDVDGTGREIIWMSERDGWNHLYLVDGRGGRVRNQITRGDWVVRRIVSVDAKARQVIFAANGREGGDPYLQHFYRVGFDGRGLTRLTQADAFHDVSFSPDGQHFIDTYSRTDMAPVSELRRTSDGALVDTIERADISRLIAAGWKAPETFVAKGRDGKTDIWGMIVRPRDFDPAKKYPVIENIYGAGFDAFVPKKWWPFGFHAGGDEVVGMQAQADLGFIVVQIDGMGTLHRSKAFHDVTWKNVGEGGAPDRILWHKAAAAKYTSYDVDRVGLYGGSLGGQNALGGLLFFPDFYKAAVAYNGCHDNRMDKISWNEQWMGWPIDESYSRSSNVDNAWRLKGDLLLISGELDMNVDPAATMQVADRLIKAGKDFELLVVPGADHGVGRSEEPMDYVLRRQYDFFARTLRGETPPRWNRTAAVKPAA